MSEFFAMGGYAVFVWSAYAVAAIVLSGILVSSLKSMRDREALVESLRSQRMRNPSGDAATGEQAT